MPQRDVQVQTPDGTSPASLHVPEGNGPWPAVIMYPDAGGLRQTIREMAEQLSSAGYVTLAPDVFYRHGEWAPFDMRSAFSDPAERGRIMGMVRSVTPERLAGDAAAWADYLLGLPETRGEAIGTTGYCMGGRLSLISAASLGKRVAAAASFHGGNIAKEDDPASPHHRAAEITATVYVAGATSDGSFPQEQRERLEAALSAAGVKHTIETYPGRHGFAVKDNATYDLACAERHWRALSDLYASALN